MKETVINLEGYSIEIKRNGYKFNIEITGATKKGNGICHIIKVANFDEWYLKYVAIEMKKLLIQRVDEIQKYIDEIKK